MMIKMYVVSILKVSRHTHNQIQKKNINFEISKIVWNQTHQCMVGDLFFNFINETTKAACLIISNKPF